MWPRNARRWTRSRSREFYFEQNHIYAQAVVGMPIETRAELRIGQITGRLRVWNLFRSALNRKRVVAHVI